MAWSGADAAFSGEKDAPGRPFAAGCIAARKPAAILCQGGMSKRATVPHDIRCLLVGWPGAPSRHAATNAFSRAIAQVDHIVQALGGEDAQLGPAGNEGGAPEGCPVSRLRK